MKWKRPDGPYPRTYVEFEGKEDISGKKRKFWIQDLTEEYFEVAIEAYVNDFLKDEPLNKYLKVVEDPLAIDDFRKTWRKLMAQRMSLICFAEGEDSEPQVAGFNCLFVIHKDDVEEDEVQSPKSQKIRDIMHYLDKDINPFAKLGIEEYLYAFGLSVLTKFRGESLGLRILNAREPLCKQFGVKATLTVFTSKISQKLACRDGFQDLHSLRYEDYPPDLQIPGISEHSADCKLMYKMF